MALRKEEIEIVYTYLESVQEQSRSAPLNAVCEPSMDSAQIHYEFTVDEDPHDHRHQ